MGNGVYGVEAASRDLFGKSVNRINLPQAAMLAALPKAPSTYTPRRHPQRALERRNLVLGLMVKEGYVSANRLPGLQASPNTIAKDEFRPKDPNDSFALDAVRSFVDSIIQGGQADIVDLTVRTSRSQRAIAADRRASTGFVDPVGKRDSFRRDGATATYARSLASHLRAGVQRALFAHRQPDRHSSRSSMRGDAAATRHRRSDDPIDAWDSGSHAAELQRPVPGRITSAALISRPTPPPYA
jgi:membrane peptidoglycan carboxypeptidase